MARIREIRKRIKAVGNIKRITKTMQMIATAKFQASSRRTQGTRPFTQKLSEVVGELASSSQDGSLDHPLLSAPVRPAGRRLVLVVSSNRGLCGAYNSNILRKGSQFLREPYEGETRLEVIGKKALAYFRFTGQTVSQSYSEFGDKPAYEQIEKLAEGYMAQFLAGKFDSVKVIYMQFISNSRQVPTVMQLLPMEKPEGKKAQGGGVYEFSPAPQALLQALLPMAVKTRLFQAVNEALVSEHLARMVAMKSATDNASKMGRSLKRKFNRARQTQITTELSEIIGGAAAMA